MTIPFALSGQVAWTVAVAKRYIAIPLFTSMEKVLDGVRVNLPRSCYQCYIDSSDYLVYNRSIR
jgi:hypothetical protein